MQINPNFPDFNVHNLSSQNIDKTQGNQDASETSLQQQFFLICANANNLLNSIEATLKNAEKVNNEGNPERAKTEIDSALPGWEDDLQSLQKELKGFSQEVGTSSPYETGIQDMQKGIDDLNNMCQDLYKGNYNQGLDDFKSASIAIQAAFLCNR